MSYRLVEELGPQVRIEQGGKLGWYRVMVKHGHSWMKHNEWPLRSLKDAHEYIQERLSGIIPQEWKNGH